MTDGLSTDAVRTRQLQGKSKIAFPFAAGWADLAGFEAATYSKHGRVVRLQGIVTKTAGVPAGGNVIGTLPVGFRPTATVIFVVWTGSPPQAGRLDVQANGDVVWSAGGVAETDFTNLSGVSFVVPA